MRRKKFEAQAATLGAVTLIADALSSRNHKQASLAELAALGFAIKGV